MSEANTDKQGITNRIVSRILSTSALDRIFIALAAVFLALLLGSVVVAATGNNPVLFVYALLYGAIGTTSNISLTLQQATLLCLAGVAVAVSFKSGLFNIGVQGQFVLGGFATTIGILWLSSYVPSGVVGGILLVAFGTVAGILAGGMYAAIPGLMKAYADANEVITTIMLNFIATGVTFYLIDQHFHAANASATNTESIPTYAMLPSIVFGSPSFSVIGVLIALAAVIGVHLIMNRTRFGYDLVTSGKQAPAAAFSGVNPKKNIVGTMVFSGMFAGLAGAVFVVMVLGYYSDPGTLPQIGFNAIAVSLLAANNPLAVVPAGLLFGGLEAGKQYIGYNMDIQRQLVDGIVGLIVLFVATPELFRMAILWRDARSEEVDK